MSVSLRSRGSAATTEPQAVALQAGLLALAAYHVVLAVWMAASPHSFFTSVGPFGTRNDHYIRDTATFNAAFGAGLLVAVRKPTWRVPVLTLVTVQFALHSVNHLVDIGNAHPAWTGYFDFFSLAAATALLLWLLTVARAQARASKTAGER